MALEAVRLTVQLALDYQERYAQLESRIDANDRCDVWRKRLPSQAQIARYVTDPENQNLRAFLIVDDVDDDVWGGGLGRAFPGQDRFVVRGLVFPPRSSRFLEGCAALVAGLDALGFTRVDGIVQNPVIRERLANVPGIQINGDVVTLVFG